MELILLDEDLDYAQTIRDFLQQWDGGTGVTLKQFTKPEVAIDYARRNPSGTVLLAAEQLAVHVLQEPYAVIVLTEQLETDREGRMSKFQPLDQLMLEAGKALTGVRAGHCLQSDRRGQRTRIAGWFSAAGGCGKSTAAYNLSLQLAQRGEEVIFIGLESLSSGFWRAEGGEGRLSEWLYFAKTKPKLAADRVDSIVLEGPHPRMRIAAPFEHTSDALDMTDEDVVLMLDSLAERRSFSWIVIDNETGWGPRQKGAAGRSDIPFWIVTDDAASVNKTAGLIAGWKRAEDEARMKNICWTQGKYVGVSPSGCDRLGIKAEAALPYVPQWKSVKRAEELHAAEFYSQQLWHAFRTASERRKKGGTPAWTESSSPS